MKRLLSFILAVVYFFGAGATVQACSAYKECCGSGYSPSKGVKENCCKDELQQVRVEDHQQTSNSYCKAKPLSSSAGTHDHLFGWGFEAGETFRYNSSYYIADFAEAVPLFIRHCHFRI